MGLRGYVFIKLNDGITPQGFLDIRRKLEAMDEVIRFDNVIDVNWFDMLALVDAGIMVKNVAQKIENISGVHSAQSSRVVLGPEF